MTPLLRFTRTVYVAGVCLTAGTGIGLFAAPGRTADYWAWTIKAPLTAAFFGAGYLGAAGALALAARARWWEETRTVAIAAFALTSLALLVTLRNTGGLAFGDGGLPEAVAWFWLAVYVALPPLVLVAFVRQERRGLRGEQVAVDALAVTRLLLAAAGSALGLLGVALLANAHWLASRWPWPAPRLPAGVIGAWLCTYAAAFLWFAVRERSWARARLGFAPVMISLLLDLIAAARLRDGFGGGAAITVYIAALVALLVLLGAVAFAEERRRRNAPDTPARPAR